MDAEAPKKGILSDPNTLRRKTLENANKLSAHIPEGTNWSALSPEARTLVDRFFHAYWYLSARDERKAYHAEGLPVKVIAAAQIFLLRNGPDGIEIFLGKRSAGGFMNQWCVPGGRKDQGETDEEAAIRELKEETGVVIDVSSLIHLIDHNSHTIREKNGKKYVAEHHIHAYAVLAQDLTPTNMSEGEHTEMKWMPIKEALAMHEAAVQFAADGVDEDTIENALPAGVRGILMTFGDDLDTDRRLAKQTA